MTGVLLHRSDTFLQSAPIHGNRPIRVAIYCVTTAAIEHAPIRRTLYQRVKTGLRRRLELLRWRLTGRWRGHYSTFEDHSQSNRGDFAIRLGLRRHIAAAFSSPVTIEEIPWRHLDTLLHRAHADMPDLLVICGGGLLFPDDRGRLAPWVVKEIGILERISCPVVATALGINYSLAHDREPRLDDDARDAVRRLLAVARVCSVRCALTADILPRLAPVRPTPLIDPAFLLFPPPAARVFTSGGRARIGINLAFHGLSTTGLQQQTLPVFIAALRALSARTPCEFLYFVHSDAEWAMAAAIRLAGIPCAIVDGPIETLVAAYGTLDLHIGQMLHSGLLAMSQNTPALVLGYDVKAIGVLRLLGLEECFLNMYGAEVATIAQMARDILRRRETIVAKLSARRGELEAASDAFYRGLLPIAREAVGQAQ